jgi:hypothetical protein
MKIYSQISQISKLKFKINKIQINVFEININYIIHILHFLYLRISFLDEAVIRDENIFCIFEINN